MESSTSDVSDEAWARELEARKKRKLQVLGVQNGEHLRLTGKLWGWSNQQKKFFKKTFDSKTSFAASSQLTHFYNRDIRNGSVLSIYRDLKSNRIHFDINGEEGWVNFSQNEPDFWYGYIRLSSTGSGSKIQVTLVPEKDQAPFRVVPDSRQGSAEISWLSHHYVMHTSHPRGICLLINNVPKLVVVEEKLKNLFKFLSFDVVIKRRLQRDEVYNLAKKFAKKNHTYFDTFVVIFLSVSDQCNKISCADGRNASLEHFMEEFTASRCPSLRGKPKLFFVQRFRGTSSTVNDECSIFASGSSAEKDAVWLPYIPTSEEDSCPEEADFLVVSVTSTYPTDQPNRQPESLFIQLKDNGYPNLPKNECFSLSLGSTPPSALITSAVAQQASYEMNKNPRGLCVIVNNVDFQNKDLNRPGADIDERSLQLLFKTLLFEVIIRRDLMKHELEKVAQDFGEANHEAYNAFVFIVMSHGEDRDCILGVDGRGCQRGADNSMPSSANDISLQVVTTSSREQKSSQPCGTAYSTDSTLPRSVFPPEADFVLAFATAPGYVSYRDPHHGARFIQDLVEVINKYHRRHHFLEILTEVTRLVVERGNSVQVPAPMDTLTKFLYL
ncbi:hypothetical protein pdam_00024050 [Pocillopora damicornis]|uniref:Caspase family p20 domain-containing protein n=1 Tax=Pocillopora damicornis TaxID=46731 RepID=A0A3M6UW67_POCDA|nr:hypothetical protein pdam_00024050 [Pocillopora damicornis]